MGRQTYLGGNPSRASFVVELLVPPMRNRVPTLFIFPPYFLFHSLYAPALGIACFETVSWFRFVSWFHCSLHGCVTRSVPGGILVTSACSSRICSLHHLALINSALTTRRKMAFLTSVLSLQSSALLKMAVLCSMCTVVSLVQCHHGSFSMCCTPYFPR